MAVGIGDESLSVEKGNGHRFADGPLPQLPADKRQEPADALSLIGLLVPEIGDRITQSLRDHAKHETMLPFARRIGFMVLHGANSRVTLPPVVATHDRILEDLLPLFSNVIPIEFRGVLDGGG